MGLSEELLYVLKEWQSASSSQMRGHPLADRFRTQLKSAVEEIIKDGFPGFVVKASPGAGNWANVPWVSILDPDITRSTQDGIYPVYLFKADASGVYLSFNQGTTRPTELLGAPRAREHAAAVANAILKAVPALVTWGEREIDLRAATNLGQSYEYPNISAKFYSVENFPDEETLKKDLLDLLAYYKASRPAWGNITTPVEPQPDPEIQSFSLAEFRRATSAGKLKFQDAMITRFVTSLATKPFVILTGLAGSGKTKLAQAFASWICENEEEQVCMVPVGADWTNREPLLGYPNALESGKYVKPDSGVVDLLIRASADESRPYFLILDEMNLSHVERYFADFLSTMESEKSIPLHAGTDDWEDVPAAIRLPKNLFVVGTVNVDETTYMFSPKVLDRANVIDFRVTEHEMEAFLQNPVKPDLDALKGAGSGMAADFVRIATGATPDSSQKDEINNVLISFFNVLKKTGAEFGYRTASEIHRLAGMLNYLTKADGSEWETDAVIDAAVIQKLLPKVHGSRSKLEPVLTALAELCLVETATEIPVLLKGFEDVPADIASSDQVRFKQSLEKILRMRTRVTKDGFTSFAEA